MKRLAAMAAAAVAVTFCTTGARADVFGVGANEFTLDFVSISGDTNPGGGYGIVNNDFRMGAHEITQGQWDKFVAAYGAVTGFPADAYAIGSVWIAPDRPANNVSWYEAAQFVNWLNTSTGHQAAYKFTGTQGTGDYTLGTWSAAEADNGTNLYRHKDAYYYIPTEDEWVKAAYWNGSAMQLYATKPGETLHQGDGTTGAGWNYYDDGWATGGPGPWDVGSGSEELNGTFDMMGNVSEWTESPYSDSAYGTDAPRALRGGAYNLSDAYVVSFYRRSRLPNEDEGYRGFRVASAPEPATISLLALGGLAFVRRRR